MASAGRGDGLPGPHRRRMAPRYQFCYALLDLEKNAERVSGVEVGVTLEALLLEEGQGEPELGHPLDCRD